MEFRNDIQGLRALAVLLVFIFHLSSSWLPGGFIGVDIFFVISGYLVSSIILHKLDNRKFRLLEFYESRIKRIVPAYFFFLLITALIASFVFVSTDVYSFRKSFFWSLIFNSNNYFATLDNYFGTASSENPLLHTWTLAVEMQFYLILPVLLLMVRNRKLLNLILIGAIIALLGYGTYNIKNGNAHLMYFSLPARMPEFLIGVLATTLNIRNSELIKKYSYIISPLGLILLLITAFSFNELTPFPSVLATIPCLGAVMLLVSSNNKVNDLFSNKILVFIGEISYSVYLWHWPVMAFIRYNNDTYELSMNEKIFVVFATIVLSLLSYYLVERFLRKTKGLRFFLPFGVLSAATASMVVFALKISQMNHSENKDFFSPSFGLESHGSTFKKVETFGDISSNDSILFIGDSHGLVMKKFVDIVGKTNGISFRSVTNDAYPTIPGIDKIHFKEIRFYNQYLGLIKEVEKELPKSKLIIIQFSSDGKKWKDAIKSFLSKLNTNQRVLVLADFPVIDKNPVKLNKGIVKDLNRKQKYIITKNKIDSELYEIFNNANNVKYVDMSNSKVFMDIPFYNDTLMYYDRGHLNIYGAEKFAIEENDRFLEAINWGLKNE
ncbi:acyltransferase family protein [Sphingobacterium kyonggiense]